MLRLKYFHLVTEALCLNSLTKMLAEYKEVEKSISECLKMAADRVSQRKR